MLRDHSVNLSRNTCRVAKTRMKSNTCFEIGIIIFLFFLTRFESRKRKVLKRTDGKYEIERSDDDNDDAASDVTMSLTANVKDLEFKLRHDLNKLYKVSHWI